jgi:hypothetical protein
MCKLRTLTGVQSQLPPRLFCDFSKQAALLISLLRLQAAFAISTETICILQAGSMRSFAFSTGLSHALHQVRKQGRPSSPAPSSPKGGSGQEIADIPVSRPRRDAHRARGSLIFAPLQHAGYNASANSLRSVQQLLHRLQSQPLRHLGTEADVEVGFTDPHPMQDARELTRDIGDRAQHARPFGDPQAPCPQCRPFPDPQQKACSRLA